MPQTRKLGIPRHDRNPNFSARLNFKNYLGALSLFFVLAGSGCDRMITPRSTQIVKEAEAKMADGDYLHAISLYESALDGSQKSADIHYRLALIYDDKMNDQLNALHHFKRYLTLNPDGARAKEVKTFMKRDELALVTNFSGDSVVSRAEAVRLKADIAKLNQELEDQRLGIKTTTAGPNKKGAGKKAARSYTVRRGDTLASISRKFYKSSTHWKQILDANSKVVDDPQNLKVGQTLTIP